MIIAIDGPSGSGKSSIAKIIAKKLNIQHLDTGAMYRLLALKLIKENKEFDKSILENLNILIKGNIFYLDGIDVSEEIRENEVSKKASDISKIKEVREYMVSLQRKIAGEQDIILDGRDIGTIVFPDAKVKIFLTASLEQRAKRRHLEDKNIGYEKILYDMKKRDEQDSTRQNSPLKVADDAIVLDTTKMDIDEVTKKIIEIVEKKKNE
ncbi:(d)CMP kinase [Caviibacter abscessus]|uniref:(d)CMP kinase n=1 Tax=Caviibacter abscessus TaxID=1766719 RepID=UPI0008322AA2|nr:(d)CMP kinase [Caviibacter abscessus]